MRRPGAVAVGDFNHDGIPDLAIDNHYNDVAIFLGRGNGSFVRSAFYTLDTYVQGQIAIADFNQDGNEDLILVCGGQPEPATFAFLPGNGDGTFGAASYISADADGSQLSIVAGDLNNDGVPDIFMGGNGASLAAINLLGGNFQPESLQPAAGFGVGIGDFNHDGNLDVAVSGGPYQNIAVLLGNGDGSFQTPISYPDPFEPLGIAVADFNHDNNLDLAIADYAGSLGKILLGNGDGSFHGGNTFGAGMLPATLVAADFNQDTNVDLAVSDFHKGTVAVLRGKGDGTFLLPVFYPTGTKPTMVTMGDFNLDGSMDLVAINGIDNTVTVLLNDSGTSVRLSSSNDPSQMGQPVTFTASVSATVNQSSQPAGAVAFRDGSNLLANVAISGGTATFTTSSLTQGTHKIRVEYSGDNFFNPNRSAILVQTVQ